MRVEGPQIPNVYLADRSGCCFHLIGILGDIGSALYHLETVTDKGELQSRSRSEAVALTVMIHVKSAPYKGFYNNTEVIINHVFQ